MASPLRHPYTPVYTLPDSSSSSSPGLIQQALEPTVSSSQIPKPYMGFFSLRNCEFSSLGNWVSQALSRCGLLRCLPVITTWGPQSPPAFQGVEPRFRCFAPSLAPSSPALLARFLPRLPGFFVPAVLLGKLPVWRGTCAAPRGVPRLPALSRPPLLQGLLRHPAIILKSPV